MFHDCRNLTENPWSWLLIGTTPLWSAAKIRGSGSSWCLEGMLQVSWWGNMVFWGLLISLLTKIQASSISLLTKIQASSFSLFAWSYFVFAWLYEIFICIIKSLTSFLCFSLVIEIQEYKHRQVAFIKCLNLKYKVENTVISELAGDKKNCNPLGIKENGNDADIPCCS